MTKIEFKKVVSKGCPIIVGYTDLLNLNNEYMLANSGILINYQGDLVWSTNLEHYFSTAIYIKEKQMLLTNRTIYLGMAGERSLGIACIDMKTGDYIWRHFYDQYESRINLRKKEPNINMVVDIKAIDINKNCVYVDGFKIDLDDGSYLNIGETKVKEYKSTNVIYSQDANSLKKRINNNNNSAVMFNIAINIIYINDQELCKEGYFFNKCDFIMESDQNMYFFGIPAKRNSRNAILFEYSKILKKVVKEIELPFRNAPCEVYDFFGKGMMIFVKGDIYLFEGFYLE